MIDTQSKTEQIADQYGRYVEELREFFRSSGLAFGSPEHLAGLTKRLREDNVFREEMYSMTRSIIFREGGALPATELLRLLAAAAGGAAFDGQADQHRPEIRYLLHFLTMVTRTPVNQPRTDASRPAAAQGGRKAAPVDSGAAVHQAAVPWSGKPSGQALKWSELWNDFAVPGGRRLFQGGHRGWWIAGSGAALASIPLLLWMSHAKAPAPVAPQRVASRAALNAPQVSLEPEPLERADTSPVPPPVANDGGSSRSKVPVTVRQHPGVNAPSRKQAPAASVGKVSAPVMPKGHLAAPHSAAPTQLAPAKHAATQTRALPPAPSTLVLEKTDGGPRRGERSPADVLPPSPSRRGVLDVSSGVMSANLISAPAPEYPRLANVIHLQGEVILQAVIGKNGQVTATYVLRGHHLLRDAAVHAVRQWRYRPFLADGQPVDVATVVTVDFRRKR